MPFPVAGAIYKLGLHKRLVIIEPFIDSCIFFAVQLQLNGLEGFNIQQIISIVQWRFLIIKWRKAHSFKMSPIPLLSPHHDPHCTPLRKHIKRRGLSIKEESTCNNWVTAHYVAIKGCEKSMDCLPVQGIWVPQPMGFHLQK